MKIYKKFFLFTILLLSIFGFSLNRLKPVFGQTFSNCVVVKVGNPKEPPKLPPDCGTTSTSSPSAPLNLVVPPGTNPHPSRQGYYKLPPSPSGGYKSYTCAGRSWGSIELISVLHTVAERWKQKYPSGRLNIGDLNAAGHKSHKWGRAVDLDATTNGKDWVADFTKGNYNRQATIELGKMFVDTNHVLHIWYNDQAVNSAVLEYARTTKRSPALFSGQYNSPSRGGMRPIPGHNNHFHLDIDIPKLSVWEPDC